MRAALCNEAVDGRVAGRAGSQRCGDGRPTNRTMTVSCNESSDTFCQSGRVAGWFLTRVFDSGLGPPVQMVRSRTMIAKPCRFCGASGSPGCGGAGLRDFGHGGGRRDDQSLARRMIGTAGLHAG